MKITAGIAIESMKKIIPDGNSVNELNNKKGLREAELKKKSSELEAVFLTQLIKSMEKTVPEGMGGGKNSMSSMMFSSVLGDAMSQNGGIGLSKMIFESLKRMDSSAELKEFGGKDYLQSLDVLQNMSSLDGIE